MSEDDRYIIHDVVFAEYPDLIASSVGEESERHILVYRKVEII
jgi:predicted RNA-binding protein Jag